VSDLEQWLSLHGLPRYAKTFADNDIDVDVLGHLTDGDLDKLGLSLGHRRKLLGVLKAVPVAPSRSAQVARQQGATVLELRAALSLARAATATDSRASDREPLRDVCAGLPAEFDAADLEEAREFLG
jgi:hypothetical protein